MREPAMAAEAAPDAPGDAAPQREAGSEVVRLEQVTKSYGHVHAVRGVDVSVRSGRICALVGDNGAGKSTILKILAGAEQPTSGTLYVDGRPVVLTGPRDAVRHGIATVHQDLALVDCLSVAENLYLGHELIRSGWLPSRLGLVARRRMEREAERALSRLGIVVPSVRETVSSLSGGQRQAVAIARAVFQGSDALLLDEPTAALGLVETAKVIALVRTVKESGRAVLLISHSIDEVTELADEALVMRAGHVVGRCEQGQVTRQQIMTLLKEELT